MKHDAVAVLDFGGQYVHLIATKIRSLGVFAEILDPDDPVEPTSDSLPMCCCKARTAMSVSISRYKS